MKIVEGKVPAADIDIAYKAVGQGKPLLVVHGGPGLGHAYMRGLDVWGDEFQVVYYDQRGSGGTELGNADKVTCAGGIEDLDGFRLALGIERANIVGHSTGALLAMLHAAQHPAETASLVLLNPGPPFVPELQQLFGAEMASRRTSEDAIEMTRIQESAEFAAGDPQTLERFYRTMYMPFFRERETGDSLDLGFTDITAANVLQAADRTFRDLGDHDPIASLANIHAPTLIVYGELEPIPEDFARLLADKIERPDYIRLPGANHFPHVEDPQALTEAVKPFLRRHAA